MITKLPGSKWFIETDDTTLEITGTYNKAAIVADIQAIRETLTRYPNITQDASDFDAVLAVIVGKWTPAKNERIVILLNKMKLDYQDDPLNNEGAQLQRRLDDLIILRDRLI